MITDADFDRSLRRWLADGEERAPQQYVHAALLDVAGTAQRQPTLLALPIRRSSRPAGRSLAAGLVVGMLGLAAVIAIAVGGRSDPSPTPSSSVPLPSARSIGDFRTVSDEEVAVTVAIPPTWRTVASPCCELVRFAGTEPVGEMSISHDSPFRARVCTLACTVIDLPVYVPYSAAAEMDALGVRLDKDFPGGVWRSLPPETIPELVEARRLDTVVPDVSGAEWHQVFVIGTHSRHIVAVSWRQPADTFDAALVDRVFASIRVTSGAEDRSGVMVDARAMLPVGYTISVPDTWLPAHQPLIDHRPADGVRRFLAASGYGAGMVTVSVGDAAGSIVLCDPACRTVRSARTLGDLETAVRAVGASGPTTGTTLDGAEARSVGTAGRRWMFAIHAGRPVVLAFDVPTATVDPGFPDTVVGSLRFDTPTVPVQTYPSADGTLEIALPGDWQRVQSPGAVMHMSRDLEEVWILRGDKAGRFRPCLEPLGRWEDCSEMRSTTGDALEEAVTPESVIDMECRTDCGPLPTWTRDTAIVSGEPAVVTIVEAYASHSTVWVAYVTLIHEGRPVVLRVSTPEDPGFQWLDDIIAGFRFLG